MANNVIKSPIHNLLARARARGEKDWNTWPCKLLPPSHSELSRPSGFIYVSSRGLFYSFPCFLPPWLETREEWLGQPAERTRRIRNKLDWHSDRRRRRRWRLKREEHKNPIHHQWANVFAELRPLVLTAPGCLSVTPNDQNPRCPRHEPPLKFTAKNGLFLWS